MKKLKRTHMREYPEMSCLVRRTTFAAHACQPEKPSRAHTITLSDERKSFMHGDRMPGSRVRNKHPVINALQQAQVVTA